MGRALLARAAHLVGNDREAWTHLVAARRALTPSVPAVRAVRVLEEVAERLDPSLSPQAETRSSPAHQAR